LRQAGHRPIWLDLLFESDRFEQVLNESRPDLVGISVRNIDDVLIRKQETFVDNLPALVETIHRRCGCPVVLGGSGFSILPRELLDLTGADFGIVGEGEVALPALVEALKPGGNYREIPGLVFRQGGTVEINAAAKSSPELGLDRGNWPPEITAHYLRNGGVLNIQTQRGCARRCCYCTYPLIEGPRHRRRSALEVAAEFEHLQSLGAHYAFVVDSVFNSSERHLTEVCEALVRSKLKIRWGCFLRPQGLTREMMQLMARAGLAHIEFGSDSFCDEVLEAYQKDLTFEDIRLSTELARRADIDLCHFVIAGGPGETQATLEIGFKNSKVLGGPIIMAVPGMRVYPGTPLFERAVAEGQIQPGANLLKPVYYLAPGLTLENVLETLKTYAGQSPNWVVGDFDPGYDGLVVRLRKRGVSGPLWSYFATAQRLWPRSAPQTMNQEAG
jgi:radical SAM superfamily enzyme YgiQ (UPF0313 family)